MESCFYLYILLIIAVVVERSKQDEGNVRISGSVKQTEHSKYQSEDNVIRIEKPTEGTEKSRGKDGDKVVHRVQGSMEGTECEACSFVIESFKLGMNRTNKRSFEGGDAEYEKNRRYATSELRFVEIQEKLCLEIRYPDQTRCLDQAEKQEKHLKKWWLKNKTKNIDLFDYVCVKTTGLCPPVPKEKPKNCGKGYIRNITDYLCVDVDECSNGQANCKHGEWCLNVNGTFYCLACHPHCDGCTGGGLKNCINQRYSTGFAFLKMRLGLEWVEPGHVLLGFYLCLGLSSGVFLLVVPKLGAVGVVFSLLLYFLVYPFPPVDV